MLIALCRPYRHGQEFAAPATNRQIGEEVHLSVEAIKDHLKRLSEKLEIGPMPQNLKRMRVVERAFSWGLVSPRDLE